eukprot:maker-scaffold719_size106944-snap-gene-0.28 protein:Tk04734 transcript:maker-scaffold719_size106944-snap-gene-0.28-mRNA-1 annotation:"PREDICTED: rabenosyn-5-like"
MADVKEGFLCPICMEDLGDGIQLQVHFDERHAKEDPVFIQGLKDLFGKAKKKVLNSDAFRTPDPASNLAAEQRTWNSLIEDRSLDGNFHPASGIHKDLWLDPQPVKISHTQVFLDQRRKRQGRNKRANQVLIRLEKLLRTLPTDPAKRRAHERRIVPWIEEEHVKLCPNCAKSFNFARRKHHCRLCGGVICNDCSTPTSLEFARKVTQPIVNEDLIDAEEEAPEASSTLMAKLNSLTPKKLSGSHESLNSLVANMMDLKTKDEDFRTCLLCFEILQKEARRQEATTQDTLLVRLFEQLKRHMKEGSDISEEYCRQALSLNQGEQDYQLEDAKYLRVKVLKIAENIDILSKKISNLGQERAEGAPIGPLELKLQQRIRVMAVDFIKDALISRIPVLVSEEEYEKVKRERVENASKKVAQEREAAKVAKVKFEQNEAVKRTKSLLREEVLNFVRSPNAGSNKPPLPRTGVEYGSGFVLSSSQGLSASDDPMVQQIQNLKHFIQEAKRLNKSDEVRSLEENLRELQQEYQRLQAERAELEANFSDFKDIFHKSSPSKMHAHTAEPVAPVPDHPDDYDVSGKNP